MERHEDLLFEAGSASRTERFASDPARPRRAGLRETGYPQAVTEGDHKVHVARVSKNDIALDPKFQLDFDTADPNGPARPHGVAFK